MSRIADMPLTIVRGVRTGATPLMISTGSDSALTADLAGGGMHRRAGTIVIGGAGDQEVPHRTVNTVVETIVNSCWPDSSLLCATVFYYMPTVYSTHNYIGGA